MSNRSITSKLSRHLAGVGTGLLVANGIEWYAHKYILHGKKRKGLPRLSLLPKTMAYHWQHHKYVRQHDYHDPMYPKPYRRGNPQVDDEVNLLIAISLVFTPIAKLSPAFTLTGYYAAWNFYRKHSRSHLEPDWGKENLPWHYDHHMNSNQDANWCVTKPWFDYIMGTRVVSRAELMERNPLGIALPRLIEQPLNQLVRKWRPATYRLLVDE